MYLVGNCWSGTLAIGSLRTFDNDGDAIAYAIRLAYAYRMPDKQAAADSWVRLYETTPDGPPRRIKFKV